LPCSVSTPGATSYICKGNPSAIDYERAKFTHSIDELKDGIVGDLLVASAKLLEGHESWIRLAEDGVTVSWNDPSALEYAPDVLLDLFRGRIVANLLLHTENEAEDLLVGEAVEGPSETGETGRVGEEWVRERRSDEVDGVCRDVSSLVISCAGQSTMSVLPVCSMKQEDHRLCRAL
jgi:hypothetical protein